MKISLIISFYKNLDNLDLIFKGLSKQTEKDFEVIVAEDDCFPETIEFLKMKRTEYQFPIEHISQEKDDGFRKNQMLNKAILLSHADSLVFIDGDCIPHKHFVRAYSKAIKKGGIFFGKRVNLGPEISKKIIEKKSIEDLTLFEVFKSDSDKKKEGIYFPFFSLKFKNTGLLGCNWGVSKQHMFDINGYDEDYISAGVGEDVDIEWRLRSMGLKMISMKNKAIVYHIYHARGYSDLSVQANYQILEEKKKIGNIRCLNGIVKL